MQKLNMDRAEEFRTAMALALRMGMEHHASLEGTYPTSSQLCSH